METAIGVFASRDRAEEAIKELREHLPESAIVFLTRSENEATKVSKEWGKVVGGIAGSATGLYAGIVASLLVPGLGPVFALGAGAAAVLGLAGAGGGAALADSLSEGGVSPTATEKCPEDVAFFREVLKEGRSLIVVRTESKDLASQACGILDRLGMGMHSATPSKMQASTRHAGDVAVMTVTGRITLGEGNVKLRELVSELLDNGTRKIRNKGGQLRLANLNGRINDLLHLTRLAAVFDIEPDEDAAIKSLSSPAQAVA